MSFKFITNSISTRSKVPTLSDIVKAAQTKAAMEKSAQEAVQGVVKTASAAPVKPAPKVAGEAGKGNAANLTAPKFGPGGKKVTKDTDKEVVDEKTEAAAKAAKAKKAGTDVRVKVAEDKEEGESSGQLDVEPLHQDGESTGKKPGSLDTQKKAAEGEGEGKLSDKDEADSSGQLDVEPLHQKGESTQEKPGDLDTMKKSEAKSGKKTKVAFKKIAELTPKQKEFLRKVWSMYWPKQFIDALLDA